MMYPIDTSKWYNKVCFRIGKTIQIVFYLILSPVFLLIHVGNVVIYRDWEKRNKSTLP